MTKEKIIDIMQKHWHQDGYYTASFDSDGCADELRALIEQEKKKAIEDVLRRLNVTIEVDTRPYIEAGTVNYDKPIRAFCVDRTVLDNTIENLAKEYVEEL